MCVARKLRPVQRPVQRPGGGMIKWDQNIDHEQEKESYNQTRNEKQEK